MGFAVEVSGLRRLLDRESGAGGRGSGVVDRGRIAATEEQGIRESERKEDDEHDESGHFEEVLVLWRLAAEEVLHFVALRVGRGGSVVLFLAGSPVAVVGVPMSVVVVIAVVVRVSVAHPKVLRGGCRAEKKRGV